jgi:hypothetical protein
MYLAIMLAFLVCSLGQKYLIGIDKAILEHLHWEEWGLAVVIICYSLCLY